MVNPINPGLNPAQHDTTPPIGSVEGAVTIDTLQTWNDTALGYLYTLSTSRMELKDRINADLVNDPLFRLVVYAALAENSSAANTLASDLKKAEQWSDLNSAIEDARTALDTYNSSGLSDDQDAVDTLNDAITQYTPADTPAKLSSLNDAIDTYNNYVLTKSNHPYAQTAQALNDLIDKSTILYDIAELNAYYLENHIPSAGNEYSITLPAHAPLPTLQVITRAPPDPQALATPITLTPPIPSLSHVPTINEIISAISSEDSGVIFSAVKYAFTQLLKEASDAYSLVNPLIDSISDKTLPLSFIKRIPKIFLPSVSEVSLTGNLSFSIKTPVLNTIMGREIYKSILKQQQLKIDTHPLEGDLEALTQGIVTSATQIAGKIASDYIDKSQEKSKIFDVARASAYVQAVRGIATAKGSNSIEALFTNQLENYGLSAETINSLAAAARLSLLQTALIQEALTLGLPGIIPQALGNVPSLSSANNEIQPPTNSVIEDPIVPVFLKLALLEQLQTTSESLEESQAEAVAINNAVNNALANTTAIDQRNFRAEIVRRLEEEAIFNRDQVELLADKALHFLRNKNYDVPVPTTFSLPEYIFRLEQSTKDTITNNPLVKNAVESVLKTDFDSVRQLNSALENELINAGFSLIEARQLADSITQPQLGGLKAKTLLERPGLGDVLRPEDLFQELNRGLRDRLQAISNLKYHNEWVNRILYQIIGPNSLINLIDDQVKTLRKNQDQEAERIALSSVAKISEAPGTLYLLRNELDELIKQGYSNVLSGDYMRTFDLHKLPSNYKRDLDIKI